MKGKILSLVVGCLTVAALILASCGPAAEEGEGKTITGKVVEEEEKITEEKEAVPEEVEKGPQYGGTLTSIQQASRTEPTSWDPAAYDYLTNVYCSVYMESLLVGDLSKGPRGTNEFSFIPSEYIPMKYIRGCLAESWEMPDEKTIVFHIRKGVMFQDKPGVMASRELTAEDVAFSLNRMIDSPKSNPTHYYVDSAFARDKYTAVVKLKEYNVNWEIILGWGYYSAIYPPELVEAGIADWENAVGTGPFMLTDYVSGASLTFERNPFYWDKETIDGKEYSIPFVDKLQWPVIPDESTQLAALRTGKIDHAMSMSWKYRDSLASTNPELLMWRNLTSTCTTIALRVDEKPFDDIRVRRALSMAIDRDAYIKTQLGGEAIVLSGPFSPDWPGVYTPLEELPESARELFEYNPEKAKQLLAEAGYPEGFKTEIVLLSMSAIMDSMSMVAAFWNDIGVELELKPYDYASYIGLLWRKTYTQSIYYPRFHSQSTRLLELFATGGHLYNLSMFDDPYFNEMVTKTMGMTDEVERSKLLKELNVYLIDQCPYIILPLGYYDTYAYPWVKNYFGEFNTGCKEQGDIYARMWLDLELKKEMNK